MEELFIDPDEVFERVQGGAKLIDLRTAAEFARLALPGAVHVPFSKLPTEVFQHVTVADTVICYCISGARGHEAARWLRQHGVESAFNGGGVYPLLDAFDIDLEDSADT